MRICCIALSFLFVCRAYSQTADSTIKSTTDPVVITASRMSLPLNNSVFTADLVDSQVLGKINNVLTIKEALSEIPSVLTNNRFNMAQGDRITIRGTGTRAQFGVRGIKILLDGIPLTFVDGQSQLNNLNISSLERLEVIRGASSSLYGNSSGGIINAKSSMGNSNRLSIRPNLTFGSYGLSKYGIGVSAPLLSGGVSFNGYITNSKGYRDHSDAKFGGINFLADHTLAPGLSLNTIVNYYNAPHLLNPSSLNKDDAVNNPTKSRDYIVNQGSGKRLLSFKLVLT